MEEIEVELDNTLRMNLREDGADCVTHENIPVNKRLFDMLGDAYTIDNNLAKAMNIGLHKGDFDFGYCLTTHKAQGSEWDNVLVFDDARWLKKNFDGSRQKWLYTACTRPSRKLVYVG